jgi:hypothetical protein
MNQIEVTKSINSCYGKCTSGPDKNIVYVTLSLIIIPTILLEIFISPFIWKNVSPSLVIILNYSILFSIVSLCIANSSDPGILPRFQENNKKIIETHNETIKPKSIKLKNKIINLKYCGLINYNYYYYYY